MTEVRVCQDWFLNKKRPEWSGFLMDELLKHNLDLLIKNVVKDWDFTILVSGSGEVRVGKSVLGMQIGAYWAYQMKQVHKKKIMWDLKESFIFDAKKLIKQGNKLGTSHPYSPLMYDEAGADLQGKKIMQSITQDLLDYLRECGQYNMLNILVLPEFFDLPKGIALSRSIFLLDVYYTGEFVRGYFNFYSRRQKKKLYLKGKRDLNYFAAKYDFHGRFPNFYTVNEDEYRQLKIEALKRRETTRRQKFLLQRNAAWFLLNKELGMSQEELGRRMENLTSIYTPHETISDAIDGVSLGSKVPIADAE